MKRVSIKLSLLLAAATWMVYASTAIAAKPETASVDVRSFDGGDIAPDVLDVSEMPFLALPPSLDDESENALAAAERLARAGGPGDYVSLPKADHGLNSSTGPQCATGTGPLPAPGWTLTYAANQATCSYPYTSGYYSVCFGANHYCFNQVAYTSYYDIPVGGTLRFCSVIGVPSGWSVTQANLPASCPGSGADWVMQHTSCVAGDTNCYPQAASITASPQTLVVPYGKTMGSTTINWNSTNYSNPCVWAQNTGGSPQVWGCSGTGAHSAVWPYVPAGGSTILWISNGGTASPSPNVAQVVVTGVQGTAPALSASPQTIQIPEGASGSTTVSFNLGGSGYPVACLWVQNSNGSGPQVWGCPAGQTYSGVWPYVPRGGTSRIWLSPSQTSSTPELASVTVTGVAQNTVPRIAASPQVVTIPAGQQMGSTTISYDLTGTAYTAMCIWVQNSNGSGAQVWGCVGGKTWSGVWPYVPRGGTSTVWLSTSQTSPTPRLAQVVVTGQ